MRFEPERFGLSAMMKNLPIHKGSKHARMKLWNIDERVIEGKAMRIQTLPVYSKLADEIPDELKAKLPLGWRLSKHQVETYRALTDRDGPDVVINTAMTGDGKSLAGQLPSLVRGWKQSLFAMYPTNELIRY